MKKMEHVIFGSAGNVPASFCEPERQATARPGSFLQRAEPLSGAPTLGRADLPVSRGGNGQPAGKMPAPPMLARVAMMFTWLFFTTTNIFAADLQARPPTMDSDGHFWVYRNGAVHPKMPFSPYGWMSDATNLSEVIQMDLESRERPNTVIKPPTPERDRCIRLKISWSEATWANVAFISGPDKPAWWGESSLGRYYDFRALPKKHLVFYARGSKGGEVIKAEIGTLGDKPFGDSLADPITKEVKLTTDWNRVEVDFSNVAAAELAHICNGFTVAIERATQTGSPTETVIYLDDIYFE